MSASQVAFSAAHAWSERGSSRFGPSVLEAVTDRAKPYVAINATGDARVILGR